MLQNYVKLLVRPEDGTNLAKCIAAEDRYICVQPKL